jgi:hypothetical protein
MAHAWDPGLHELTRLRGRWLPDVTYVLLRGVHLIMHRFHVGPAMARTAGLRQVRLIITDGQAV